MNGLIIENISNLYKVQTDNKIYDAMSRGKFKKSEILPVVGDKVKIKVIDEEKNISVIEEVEDRINYIKRPKIANITKILFIVSSKNPKPDLLMLDKQLAFAELKQLKSVIVLNKIDLDIEMNFKKIKQTYQSVGYKVIETNARDNIGISELTKELESEISAFSGNSGVGKSTLINDIFGSNTTVEGEISLKNKKGKNTTTSIKLYKINKDSYIADTPGFSTFDIGEIESKDLDKYFKEFKPYINKCEFVGCTHIKEQNCGIKNGVKEKNIPIERYNNYIKIYNELKDKEEHKW